MIPQGISERHPINPCLPGEGETAPSLGVRLVNAGRKQEEKTLLRRVEVEASQANFRAACRPLLQPVLGGFCPHNYFIGSASAR